MGDAFAVCLRLIAFREAPYPHVGGSASRGEMQSIPRRGAPCLHSWNVVYFL